MKNKVEANLEKFREKAFLKKCIDFLKTNWKKVAIITVAFVVAFNLFSCDSSQTDDGGLKANTWYTSTEVDILKVQNCKIHSAVLKNSGNSVFVSYYPVCQNCHISASIQSMAAPELNYPVSKNYYCDECGTTTIIKLKIEY